MGRSKRGPALFELLDQRSFRSSAQHEYEPPEDVFADEDAEDAPETEFEAPQQSLGIDSEEATAVRVEGERLHVSLTSVSAAAVAFALLVVIGLGAVFGYRLGRGSGLEEGYEAGRSSYLAGVTSDIEAARQQSPATYLVGGLLDSSAGKSDRPAQRETRAINEVRVPEAVENPGWLDGYTYVVAQEFLSRNASDAEPARRFLSEHGVDCVPVALSGGQVQLITSQGFDRKDPAQRELADQLLEKVRAIGAQYFASGGRYKLEGYFKTHTGEG